MAKYSRSLDFVLASLREASAGKFDTAAKCFEKALLQGDLKSTIAALETQQQASFDAVKKSNPTVASMFAEVAAKKKKKVTKAKGKPFGGKQAPPFGKKKVKADAVTVAEGDELDPILDEMVADGEDMLDLDGEDLTLEDLEGLEDDGVEEMPEATASDDDSEEYSSDEEKKAGEEESSDDGDDDEDDKEDKDDSEEESSDDSDGEEKKDDEEESSPAVTTAKLKVVASNLAALDRLSQSVKKPGKAGGKPAGK